MRYKVGRRVVVVASELGAGATGTVVMTNGYYYRFVVKMDDGSCSLPVHAEEIRPILSDYIVRKCEDAASAERSAT